MVRREIKLNKSSSLFLFGSRGTGKSTLIREQFSGPKTLWIDLLQEEALEQYRKRPEALSQEIATQKYDWVVIDEIQKLPKLLDRVHLEIEKQKKVKFVLTGSSARKLKRGAANLLAGRALTHFLFPFTHQELGENFDLNRTLKFGSLPRLFELANEESQSDYLRDYVRTYLKEEIIAEQIVRRIDPFKDFLEVAAQSCGEVINYSKIGNDIGVDDKTVASYFNVLEDTLVGFHLRPYHRSIRKRQRAAPKFFLFDTGIKRALDKTLRVDLLPQTSAYGKAFEHRVILEAHWANEYKKNDYTFSYLLTKDGAEIDLIVERPGEADVLIEIKSSTQANAADAKHLEKLSQDWKKKCITQIWSLDRQSKKIGQCEALYWIEGLKAIGL